MRTPAHPRVGGENPTDATTNLAAGGSSPRGRGKLEACGALGVGQGLIPAWAGKTMEPTTTSHRRRAHPRVGGENARADLTAFWDTGSSPRGRGKP